MIWVAIIGLILITLLIIHVTIVTNNDKKDHETILKYYEKRNTKV